MRVDEVEAGRDPGRGPGRSGTGGTGFSSETLLDEGAPLFAIQGEELLALLGAQTLDDSPGFGAGAAASFLRDGDLSRKG